MFRHWKHLCMLFITGGSFALMNPAQAKESPQPDAEEVQDDARQADTEEPRAPESRRFDRRAHRMREGVDRRGRDEQRQFRPERRCPEAEDADDADDGDQEEREQGRERPRFSRRHTQSEFDARNDRDVNEDGDAPRMGRRHGHRGFVSDREGRDEYEHFRGRGDDRRDRPSFSGRDRKPTHRFEGNDERSTRFGRHERGMPPMRMHGRESEGREGRPEMGRRFDRRHDGDSTGFGRGERRGFDARGKDREFGHGQERGFSRHQFSNRDNRDERGYGQERDYDRNDKQACPFCHRPFDNRMTERMDGSRMHRRENRGFSRDAERGFAHDRLGNRSERSGRKVSKHDKSRGFASEQKGFGPGRHEQRQIRGKRGMVENERGRKTIDRLGCKSGKTPCGADKKAITPGCKNGVCEIDRKGRDGIRKMKMKKMDSTGNADGKRAPSMKQHREFSPRMRDDAERPHRRWNLSEDYRSHEFMHRRRPMYPAPDSDDQQNDEDVPERID